MSTDNFLDAVARAEAQPERQTFSTGIGFLDELMDGGHAPGEIYGILGPYCSGKTTLGVRLVAEAAQQFYAEAWDSERDQRTPAKKVAFFVSYEADLNEIRRRVISCAARCAREATERGVFSRSSQLQDYERRIFYDRLRAGLAVSNEAERVKEVMPALWAHLEILNMTAKEHAAFGAKGVPGIAAAIRAALAKGPGSQCGLIVVDYVGAMAKSHFDFLPGTNGPLVAEAPKRAWEELALPFRCPVWLVHQLSGDANDQDRSIVLKHHHAADAKAFGADLDFSFVLGHPTPDQRLTLACTKAMGKPTLKRVLLQIDPDVARVTRAPARSILDTLRPREERRNI